MVNKFMFVYRDFYRLLRNFITLHDFYTKDSSVKAIFQSGRLIVDQRECRFCMKVADMAKHNTMAASSGMFLVYCDCVAKDKPAKLSIVAAVTVGSIGDLVVGNNCIPLPSFIIVINSILSYYQITNISNCNRCNY